MACFSTNSLNYAIAFYPLINSAIHHRFSRGNVGIVLIPAPLWEKVNARVTLADVGRIRRYTPHPAINA